MSEKTLVTAGYAAGASLAAAALVYVFGPTYFLNSQHGSMQRKKHAIGLANPGNDCYINCVLQAVSGLIDLRVFLVKELFGRYQLGADTLELETPEEPRDGPDKKADKFKARAYKLAYICSELKIILDALNERPLAKKNISASTFLRAFEEASGQYISKRQQDAHEFLTILVERLWDEHQTGLYLDKILSQSQGGHGGTNTNSRYRQQSWMEENSVLPLLKKVKKMRDQDPDYEDHNRFPFLGCLETQVECTTCGFKPKARSSPFWSIPLNVPMQKSGTSVEGCLYQFSKREILDDYACDYCRLTHAIALRAAKLQRDVPHSTKQTLKRELNALEKALSEDPEEPPPDIILPARDETPKRKVFRQTYISKYPKVLIIQLSRSIFTAGATYASRNSAQVAFTEQLMMGGLVQQRAYRLMSVITHRGGHHSGHYETFRLQNPTQPHSQIVPFDDERTRLSMSTEPAPLDPGTVANGETILRRDLSSLLATRAQNAEQIDADPANAAASTAVDCDPAAKDQPAGEENLAAHHHSRGDTLPGSGSPISGRLRKKGSKKDNRWWRISDERVSQCSSSDLLSMQREVYILFYELESAFRSRGGSL